MVVRLKLAIVVRVFGLVHYLSDKRMVKILVTVFVTTYNNRHFNRVFLQYFYEFANCKVVHFFIHFCIPGQVF